MIKGAKKFYDSKAWRSCRASYIGKRRKIDGEMCEMCKDKPGYIVDHIIEIDALNLHDPWITLNHDNLQYLCLECHNTKTFGLTNRVEFDTEGNILFIKNIDGPHK